MPKHVIGTDGVMRSIMPRDGELPNGKVLNVARASNIQPCVCDGSVVWYVDFRPIGGLTWGPYDTKEKAEEYEVRTLELWGLPYPKEGDDGKV